jgi:hypothetical protein
MVAGDAVAEEAPADVDAGEIVQAATAARAEGQGWFARLLGH